VLIVIIGVLKIVTYGIMFFMRFGGQHFLVAPPPQNTDEGKPWPIYFRTMAECDTEIGCYAQQS